MTYKGEKFVDRYEAEQERLRAFEARGGLDGATYALSPGMAEFSTAALEAAQLEFAAGLKKLNTHGGNDTDFHNDNGYFDQTDADVLYMLIRSYKPKHVLEIGCGQSTRVTRQAIIDGGLDTKLSAIDPYPRKNITHLVDEFTPDVLEAADMSVFDQLDAGDILFIDSSHQVRMANDVAHLFCKIIPALKPGVLIHVHDVFLPYEYPKRFFYDCPGWGEQYVLHALLQGGGYDILWPGYYLQQMRPDAVKALPFLKASRAQSFWIARK
ncbi:MAG: class I SAM-dependent methyltransferase [Pseudomonadota bacterium]